MTKGCEEGSNVSVLSDQVRCELLQSIQQRRARSRGRRQAGSRHYHLCSVGAELSNIAMELEDVLELAENSIMLLSDLQNQ